MFKYLKATYKNNRNPKVRRIKGLINSLIILETIIRAMVLNDMDVSNNMVR